MIRWLRAVAFGRACLSFEAVNAVLGVVELRSAAPKPRIRIRQDGWIRHMGGPFPFDPKCVVETVHAAGQRFTGSSAEYADYWHESWWKGEATSWRHNILFYRAAPSIRQVSRSEARL